MGGIDLLILDGFVRRLCPIGETGKVAIHHDDGDEPKGPFPQSTLDAIIPASMTKDTYMYFFAVCWDFIRAATVKSLFPLAIMLADPRIITIPVQ